MARPSGAPLSPRPRQVLRALLGQPNSGIGDQAATIAQAAIAAYAPTVRQHFDLPQDRLILCAISFGYADDAAPINRFRTQRATPEDIIDWKS